jgi:hypothetical protein
MKICRDQRNLAIELLHTLRDRSRGGLLGGTQQVGDGDKSVACVRFREAYCKDVFVRKGARIPLRGILALSSLSLIRPSQST